MNPGLVSPDLIYPGDEIVVAVKRDITSLDTISPLELKMEPTEAVRGINPIGTSI